MALHNSVFYSEIFLLNSPPAAACPLSSHQRGAAQARTGIQRSGVTSGSKQRPVPHGIPWPELHTLSTRLLNRLDFPHI